MLALAGPASAMSTNVVISQVFGGGGNTGAPYHNDFVELFNRTATPVSLAGWSVQYASATGTGNFASQRDHAAHGRAPARRQYYLVAGRPGGTHRLVAARSRRQRHREHERRPPAR